MASGIGDQQTGDTASEWNSLQFMLRSFVGRLATSSIVEVMGVTNDGDLSPVGFVDIRPCVNLLAGDGTAIQHGTISRCPYLRIQGGANAVIIDPEVGDLGIAIFADRDISIVMANKAQANPGSRRRFDMADGMYLGGVLNGTPTQWVRFSAAGIEMVSPTAIKLQAPDIVLQAQTIELNASSSLTATAPTITFNGNVVNNGNVHTTGTTLLDGVMTCEDAALLNGVLAVTGVANFSGGIFDGVKSIGGAHIHDHGTMTATGQTGTVI